MYVFFKEEYISKGEWSKYYLKESGYLDLVQKNTHFQKKAGFVWALDFPLYKGMGLGFELNAGLLKRRFKEVYESIFINVYYSDCPYNRSGKEERISREILIPINFFHEYQVQIGN